MAPFHPILDSSCKRPLDPDTTKNDSIKVCHAIELLSINKNKQEQPAGCNFSKTGVYPLFGSVYYVLQAATSSPT